MQSFVETPTDLSSCTYLCVCHDAGAANILLSNDAVKGFPAEYYLLSGPAKQKWQAEIPSHKLINKIEQVIYKIDVVVTGTGWSSNVEHNARRAASEHNVHSIALIDHWVNYLPRFTRDGEVVLPDEILVTDDDALKLAKATFEHLPVYKIYNQYLQNAKNKVLKANKELHQQVLYVLEPVHEDWGNTRDVDEEFQALDYFREYLENNFTSQYSQIRMRLHPSESHQKYEDWIKQNADLPIIFDVYEDIETSIANADWVFGCESYGLIVAIECGKPVYSTIPHWAPLARLPNKDLLHLRDMQKSSNQSSLEYKESVNF